MTGTIVKKLHRTPDYGARATFNSVAHNLFTFKSMQYDKWVVLTQLRKVICFFNFLSGWLSPAAPVDIRGARLRHLGHPGNDQGQGRDDGDDDGQDGGNSSALCTTTACGSGGESNTPHVSSHSRHGTEVPGIQSAADGKSAGNGSKSSASSGGRGSENSSGGDQGGNGASASGNDTVSSGGSGAGGNDDDDDGDKLRKPGLDNALPEDMEERDDEEEDMDCGEGTEDKAEKRKQGDVLSEDGIHPSAAKRMKGERVREIEKKRERERERERERGGGVSGWGGGVEGGREIGNLYVLLCCNFTNIGGCTYKVLCKLLQYSLGD